MMQCRPVVGRWMLHLLRSYPVDSASGGVQWTLSLRSAMDLAVKVMSNIDMTTTAMTILHGTQWIRTTGVVQQRSKRFHEEERYVSCLLLFVVVCCFQISHPHFFFLSLFCPLFHLSLPARSQSRGCGNALLTRHPTHHHHHHNHHHSSSSPRTRSPLLSSCPSSLLSRKGRAPRITRRCQ